MTQPSNIVVVNYHSLFQKYNAHCHRSSQRVHEQLRQDRYRQNYKSQLHLQNKRYSNDQFVGGRGGQQQAAMFLPRFIHRGRVVLPPYNPCCEADADRRLSGGRDDDGAATSEMMLT